MAIIHRTTMVPTKLELLASWLPGQPWYAGMGDAARLTKAGGFRLDDPDGAVGLEFMAVTDESGDQPVTYHVPLSYRGTPLTGGDDGLVGTSEHGVLGLRWIYDGTRDPLMVAQMFALLQGDAEPQAQSISDTPDPSVTRSLTGNTGRSPIEILRVTDGPRSTDVLVRPTAAPGTVAIRVRRVLTPSQPGIAAGTLGHITAEWTPPRSAPARGRFIVLRVGD